MAKEIRLPQLGQTMEEGTIVNCLVKVGDEVKKGEVIFEIETDKATLEMESPADGFVKYILAELDETLPTGAPLMVLGNKGEEVSQSFIDSLKAAPPPAEAPPTAPTTKTEAAEPKLQPTQAAAKPTASPRAKKLAKELGVNLADITGTGPVGKIIEQDVKKAASAKPPTPSAAPQSVLRTAVEVKLGETMPLSKKQKLTAERMLKSKREIPCFYLTVKADVTELVALRTKLNEGGDIKISYNDFIIKAVATGLQKFPIMTGQLVGDTIKLPCTINIGLAVSTPDGLIVPVIKDAHKKDIKQITTDTKALIEKAQKEKLLLTDLEGACITVSNLGAFGVDSFIPIVIPDQCSILGIGRITDTCVPENGSTMIRKLMNMTLAVDHKVANGAYTAQFLDFVRKLLEDTSTFAGEDKF
jgi:pyruvate dehydrogenase E2 component (dihydrolipoamide acetyltransferase)